MNRKQIALLLVLALAVAGCGSSSGSPKTVTVTAPAASATTPACCDQDSAPPAPPEPPPPPAVAPDAHAKLNGQCEYLLGNQTETKAGYRFVASATIHNTGNIGVVVRFDATWRQAAGPAVHAAKTVRVPRGRSLFVNLARVVSQDQVDQIQAVPTASQCGWKGTILRYFGKAA